MLLIKFVMCNYRLKLKRKVNIEIKIQLRASFNRSQNMHTYFLLMMQLKQV